MEVKSEGAWTVFAAAENAIWNHDFSLDNYHTSEILVTVKVAGYPAGSESTPKKKR